MRPALMMCNSCLCTTIADATIAPGAHDIAARCPACGAEPDAGLCFCDDCVADGLERLPVAALVPTGILLPRESCPIAPMSIGPAGEA